VTADKLLARSTAVLARIDQALDDPYPALVANLPGVPGGFWLCHRDQVIRVGQPAHMDDGDELCVVVPTVALDDDCCEHRGGFQAELDGYPGGCWGDAPFVHRTDGVSCLSTATTDVGLCDAHYAEIVRRP
jgi:hypothetical protein